MGTIATIATLAGTLAVYAFIWVCRFTLIQRCTVCRGRNAYVVPLDLEVDDEIHPTLPCAMVVRR